MKKRFAFKLLYLIYVPTIVLVIWYGLYLRYRATNPFSDLPRDVPTYQNLNRETACMLTFFRYPRDNSFIHFPLQKPTGIKRVGCFGDSYTYGSESGRQLDYPSLLQELVRDDGIEVINFGIPGTGFSEAYILWERVGKAMDLDWILLGPQDFEGLRDTSFHGPDRDFPRHSRFILQGNELKQLNPVGDSPWDRKRHSMRFIPYYRYLRYDRVTPTFFKALLPKKRDFKVNPFYYFDGDVQVEAMQIYSKLLDRVADGGSEIILLHPLPLLVGVANRLHRTNLRAAAYDDTPLKGFPYVRPGTHYSPHGNRIIARIMADFMAARPESKQELLKFGKFLVSDYQGAIPLNQCTEVTLSADNQILGGFDYQSRQPIDGATRNFLASNIQTLFIIRRNDDDNFTNCVFIPLESTFANGASVTLQVTQGGNKSDYHLGNLQFIAPGLPIAVITLPPEGIALGDHRLRFDYQDELTGNFESDSPLEELKLLIETTSIGRVELHDRGQTKDGGIRQELQFRFGSEKLGLFSEFETYLNLETLDQSGILMLDLKTFQGRTYRVPFARWEKQPYIVSLTSFS